MTQFISKAQAKRLTKLTYLATVSKTVKHRKSIKYGELTYSLYLAPGKTSGYETCLGRTAECSKYCMNESGMNTMIQDIKGDVINNSRIKKTRLFFEDPELFMGWLIAEIQSGITRARKLGYFFSIRLNNTSDISPEDFVYNGMNILEIFPNIIFYDYTKIADRVKLLNVYKNYDLTYSYTGYNWDICQEMLNNNIRVAVVFKKLPKIFMGYKVIDGDLYDMRFHDTEPVIIGLVYKKVRVKLTPDIKFVIQ